MNVKLSSREQELFDLLLKGIQPKEIAHTLQIKYNTVLFYQKKLYRKLDVNNISELLIKYLPSGTEEKSDDVVSEPVLPSGKRTINRKIWICAGLILLVVLLLIFFFAKPYNKTKSVIPSWARGNWHQYWDDPNSYLITDRTLTITDQHYIVEIVSNIDPQDGGGWMSRSMKYTVFETIKLSNKVYDIIFTYPIYNATEAQKRAAANEFLLENGLDATVHIGEDGITGFVADWDNDRDDLLKFYKQDYLNRYLARTLNEKQLEEIQTIWYSRIRFRNWDGFGLKINDFMDKDKNDFFITENNAYPSGNSTSLEEVRNLNAPYDIIVHEESDTNETTGDLHYWGGFYIRRK